MMVSDPVIDAMYPKSLAIKNEDELKQIFKDNERACCPPTFRNIVTSADGVRTLSAVAQGVSRPNPFSMDGNWRT